MEAEFATRLAVMADALALLDAKGIFGEGDVRASRLLVETMPPDENPNISPRN